MPTEAGFFVVINKSSFLMLFRLLESFLFVNKNGIKK